EIILYDNATFDNAGLLCAGAQDDDDDDSLSPQDLCLVLAGDASFVNESSGLIYGEYIEIDLLQNASFTNGGIIYADGDDIDVEFAPVADGSASFVNNEVMVADEFYVYWDIYAEQDDETISSNSTGTFTNNGTITATTMEVAQDIDINILVANAKKFQNMNPTGAAYFVNNGTIMADTVSVDSYVETTLKQGSQITGNLELGKASSYYYRLSATSDDNTNLSSETFSSEGTIVADTTVLNIVLNSINSDTPLIAGNLTLYTDTELNVSAEGTSKTQAYSIQLYGGELVLGEQTTTIQNSNDSETKTTTIKGKLLAEEGTFTRASDGKVFLWKLDTETGVIVALAEGIDEYFQIDETEQVADIPSTKVAAFASSLETFSGTISGTGEVHATADLSFAGNAENYSGTTFVDAGTFTIEKDAKLSAGSYDVAEDAVLAIAPWHDRTFSNATSGDGKLLVGYGAIVSFTKSVGTATLEVEKDALLSGGVTLTHADATLVLSGDLELGAGQFVSFTNGGTIVIDSSASLLLTSGSGSEFTIFSGAAIYSDEEQGVSAEEFLRTSGYLRKEAQTASVIYDTSNGLSVTIINSNQDLLSRIRLHDGLDGKFIAAITGDDDWGLKSGFVNASELDSFVSAVLNSPGSVGTALTTLSPLSYAAMVAMPSTAFHNDIRRIESRLATKRLKDSYSQQWGYIGKVDWGFFAQGQTTYLDNNGGKDSPVFDFETYGALVGAEAQVGNTFAAGLTVAYDNGKAKIHNGGGRIESDNARVTAFASCLIGELVFVNAGAQVGYGSYDIHRKTVLGRATGDTEGWNAGAFLDIGMHIKPFDEVGISFRPYVGIAYLHSRVNDFSDSKFDIDAFDGDSMRTRVGLGIFWDFYATGSTWTLGIDGSYSHDFFGKDVDIDATYLATGGSFRATAKAMSTDVFSVGPVVNIALNENIALFAGYTFDAGTNSSLSHSAHVGVSVSF
ncbi:MAG: autotransporter domain-containing protein, partial [Opitutae bacterium]|nr:autotransporter domain-containing protein [Opitutae bacterium]